MKTRGLYTSLGTRTVNGKSVSVAKPVRTYARHFNARKGQTTPEYSAMAHAKQRCQNPNDPKYANYGGRGIQFRFKSFCEFFAELGEKPSSRHTLNRIDNDGHYEVGNVEWATNQEQSRNRRSNVYITANGFTRLVVDWVAVSGLPFATITRRLATDYWCDECTVTLPPHQRCNHTPFRRKMKRAEYIFVASRILNGKRTRISKHLYVPYYRISTCNIPATTIDEAIEKYQACLAKREVKDVKDNGV